jgi:hypothetical protein
MPELHIDAGWREREAKRAGSQVLSLSRYEREPQAFLPKRLFFTTTLSITSFTKPSLGADREKSLPKRRWSVAPSQSITIKNNSSIVFNGFRRER